MTREDQALNTQFLLEHIDDKSSPLRLYRLAQAKYANLSGVGAAAYPGRWNLPGQEAIYTSIEKGVPLLERLAHTPKNVIPSNLAFMTIQLTTGSVWSLIENQGIFMLRDLDDDATIIICPTLTLANKRYFLRSPALRDKPPLAVTVPSVIVPVWNVVLYPGGYRFWRHVSLEEVEPFEFDPRLFSDSTPVEDKT